MSGTVQGVFHSVVSASDMAEAVHYYRDLPGLSVTFDDCHDPDAVSALFGYRSPVLHSVVVSCPDGSEIEIVEFESPRGRALVQREPADAGPLSINLRVGGTVAIVEKLAAEGRIDMNALRRRTPQGRLATNEEIADAILYLCEPRAAHITGHMLPVDGGWTAYGYV